MSIIRVPQNNMAPNKKSHVECKHNKNQCDSLEAYNDGDTVIRIKSQHQSLSITMIDDGKARL